MNFSRYCILLTVEFCLFHSVNIRWCNILENWSNTKPAISTLQCFWKLYIFFFFSPTASLLPACVSKQQQWPTDINHCLTRKLYDVTKSFWALFLHLIFFFHLFKLCCPPWKGNSTEIIHELVLWHRWSYLKFPRIFLLLFSIIFWLI